MTVGQAVLVAPGAHAAIGLGVRTRGAVRAVPALAQPAAPTRLHLAARPAAATRPGTRTAGAGLGWLPGLSLTCALGLGLVVVAYSNARADLPWAPTAFWAGLVVLFSPVAYRLLGASAGRNERILLLEVLGLGLYLVKTLRSPFAFKGFDDLLHVRSMTDLLATGQLFHENSMLPASPLYPGLEIVTHAVASLGGLAIFPSGVVILGVARCVFILSLFLIFQEAAKSPRTASVATLLYIANPNFTYFDASYAYESLALPMAAFSLFVIAHGASRPRARGWRLAVPALLGIGATVVTHHVTSYVLVVFLALWTLMEFIVGDVRRVYWVGGFFIGALLLAGAWLLVAANVIVSYLSPLFVDAIVGLANWINGESTGRELFKDATGQVAPLTERLLGWAAVLVVMVALPPGLLKIWQT